MATHIPSSNLPLSGNVGRPRDAGTQNRQNFDVKKYAPPHRAQFNYIPSPDALRSMIERALEALSKGIYWQRGSIINIVL